MAVGAIGKFHYVRQRDLVLNASLNARSERFIFDRTQNAQVRHGGAPTNAMSPNLERNDNV